MKLDRMAILSEQKQEEEEDCMIIRLPKLPDEIWVEIICKLPVKPLHVCKYVSTTWHSYVSQILSAQKRFEDHLSHGILYFATRYLLDPETSTKHKACELSYLSLSDYNVTRWFSVDNPKPETATITITDKAKDNCMLGGNLTAEVGCLIPPPGKHSVHWAMHRGLVVLSTSEPGPGFRVYNPTTKENFALPKPPSLTHPASLRDGYVQASIINLSDCLLSPHCNFRVVRFPCTFGHRWAEIYSSTNNQWCESELCIDKTFLLSTWNLAGAVFLDDTLFFLTHSRLVVGVKFLFLSDKQVIRDVYTLVPPPPIRCAMIDSTLHVSQGCLYLCYCKRANLSIWKRNGSSSDDAEPWIPQFIFEESGVSLCQPNAEKFLRQIVGTKVCLEPLIFHPEAPVVFIQIKKSIFAFHLLNNTVEKIVELRERTVAAAGYIYINSPCFASLSHLMHRNQPPRGTPSPSEIALPNPAESTMEGQP